MRLHSDSEIESMSKNDVLEILQVGAGYLKHAFSNDTVEDPRILLNKSERNRTIRIWHDHSTLASHGLLAVFQNRE